MVEVGGYWYEISLPALLRILAIVAALVALTVFAGFAAHATWDAIRLGWRLAR